MTKEVYIRCPWPEYQTYQGYDGFDDNAEYCADTDVYFINSEWATACDNEEIFNTYNEKQNEVFQY